MTPQEIIDRLWKATGPDRELDLVIHVHLFPEGDIARVIQHRRGFDHAEGMAWEIHHTGSVCFESYQDGRCTYNGGYPLPRYTEIVNAAISLMPPGYRLYLVQVERGWRARAYFDSANAWVDPFCNFPYEVSTLALAICIVAMHAIAAPT